MFARIVHAINVIRANVHEASKRGPGTERSGSWPRVERAHLTEHPLCAACAGRERIQVHHKLPFHAHPELELDPANLISLCMSPKECHLRIGHGGSFKTYNPNVVKDSELLVTSASPALRTLTEARAKKNRLTNEP